MNNKDKIIIYKAKDKNIRVEVKLAQETVWLTQAQIAKLFQTDRSVITKHLNNIFNSHELEEKSNVQKMHIAFSDKPVKLYNLDVIISVGYRVNSGRATQFRIWATKVLREHILYGYTINQKRLLEQTEKFKELRQTIAFIETKSHEPRLGNQAQELLRVVNEYAKSLTILEQYDEKKLMLQKARRPKFKLAYDECKNIIIEELELLLEGKIKELKNEPATELWRARNERREIPSAPGNDKVFPNAELLQFILILL